MAAKSNYTKICNIKYAAIQLSYNFMGKLYDITSPVIYISIQKARMVMLFV